MLFLLSLFPALFTDALSGNANEEDDGVMETGASDEDTLTGGDGDDIILGLLGGDLMSGGAGDDVMQGGGGEDVMLGEAGNDLMQGRGQDDTVQGFSGSDWVDGNDGNDLVRGGSGDDVVIGGEGEDAIFGRNDDDILIGGEFAATPFTTEQLAQIRDGANLEDLLPASNQIVDDGDADTLDGGNGNDFLLFGAGDSATGGAGTDSFAVFGELAEDGSDAATIEDYKPGTDAVLVYFQTAEAAEDADITVADDGDDAVVSVDGEAIARVVAAVGNLSADDVEIALANEDTEVEPPVTNGTDDAETFDLGEADDILNAGGGNDDITGGFGDDTLNGDGGADIIQGEAGFDRINGNADNDLLQGRGGDDSLSGNAGEDWVDGNDGNDLVNGGTQDDTVIGGLGEDTLSGGQRADVLVSGELVANPLSTEELSALRDGATIEDAIGIALEDAGFLQDDGAADLLDGGTGADLLFFGAGDTATGGTGADDFNLLQNSLGNGLGAAVITDFDSAEDELFLVLDGAMSDSDPVITIETEGADASILVDGEILAQVTGGAGLTADQVQLVSDVPGDVFNPNF
ncbi:calcium-binding protein [Tateyamaria sp.]|uniref:calcium-binding protein n=1 Tax=Tateyamaria sp. TaxID=1929288 RepID=UPI003B228E41